MCKQDKRIIIMNAEPVSMIDRNGLQRVNFKFSSHKNEHCILNVFDGKTLKFSKPTTLLSGENSIFLMLPKAKENFNARFQLIDTCGEILDEMVVEWKKPLEREFYIVVSSHTDIGLHNSQYIQRYNSEAFLDQAAKLIDETESEDANDRYRYTIEGTWFWNNYPDDRGEEAAREKAEDYIKKGKIGICGGIAGNHTHVYGAEELCRSVYSRKQLKDKWGISTNTISMIDNNGLSLSIIQPYADAGIKNIFFSPNQWNPIPSAVWNCNTDIPGYLWNSEAGGGGARIDVRYTSNLPMLFWWESIESKQKMLVWCSLQYDNGSKIFGFNHRYDCSEETLRKMEKCFAERLPLLDKKYPYRIWLMADYGDDQSPDLKLQKVIKEWNKRWLFPKLRMSGNIDEPFEIIREEYGEVIPTVKGDITGGWYQHPLATAELTARKLNADRKLSATEKACVIAALTVKDFRYPKETFDRAWNELLMNDEHSYGTSGYAGRRVFETWLQHRVWIENTERCIARNMSLAFKALCEEDSEYLTFFNPSGNERNEIVDFKGKIYKTGKLPPLEFITVKKSDCELSKDSAKEMSGLLIEENDYYRVEFAENGSIKSIYDKDLKRELVETSNEFRINEFVYTKDNHVTFSVPKLAKFNVSENDYYKEIAAFSDEEQSGACLVFITRIYKTEKKIEFDDRIYHARDMFNNDRWKRYIYIAIPVCVAGAKRIIYHNGVESEYAKDVTGHGTDVYAACNEWCCAENGEFGVGLVMRDSQIVEFDHIHPDKTDYGNAGKGSAIYSYVANDWLQRHVSGGSYINFRFRYLLTSYKGDHKKANLSLTAENFVNDLEVFEGKLRNDLKQPKFSIPYQSRIVGMKPSEDGEGVIVRTSGTLQNRPTINGKKGVRTATDEKMIDEEKLSKDGEGLATWYFDEVLIRTDKKTDTPAIAASEKPKDIGSEYTGLIDEPKAVCGENCGELYLLWGQSMERNLSHYELYRGETKDFEPGERSFIAYITPEVYRVARYLDSGLKDDKEYFYRVRSVNTKGEKSAFSTVFSGRTRELIGGKEQKFIDLSGRATSESTE